MVGAADFRIVGGWVTTSAAAAVGSPVGDGEKGFISDALQEAATSKISSKGKVLRRIDLRITRYRFKTLDA